MFNSKFLIFSFILSGCFGKDSSLRDHEADCGTSIVCDNGFFDEDGDGFCDDVDCNDRSCEINPGAAETCGGGDEDCDDLTDTADDDLESDVNFDVVDGYLDQDYDGYYSSTKTTICAPVSSTGLDANEEDCIGISGDYESSTYSSVKGQDCCDDSLDEDCIGSERQEQHPCAEIEGLDCGYHAGTDDCSYSGINNQETNWYEKECE